VEQFTPTFKLTANQQDITRLVKSQLVQLRIMDEAGYESDELEITLGCFPEPIALPPKGAVLDLWLGWNGENKKVGQYIVDERKLQGTPTTMTLIAKAAQMEGVNRSAMQSMKTRTWAAGTTIGTIVATVAANHNLNAAVAPALASIVLPAYHQRGESDINLLTRLAKDYDATFKVAEGRVVFAQRGAGTSVSGKALPKATIRRTDIIENWSWDDSSRNDAGTVRAAYRNRGAAKDIWIEVGSGEPIRTIRTKFPNAASARAAANSRLNKGQREGERINLTIKGATEIKAEALVELIGFYRGVDKAYSITRVEHNFTTAEFTTLLEAVKLL
jgi:phage protein D